MYSSIQYSKNQYGESVDIANLSTYTQGKPTDKDSIDLIKNYLYKIIKLNTPNSSPEKITDISIRDGSFSQEYAKDDKLHTVNFIVDIPSLKQSYNVSYQWIDSGGNRDSIGEYGTIVNCLKEGKVIYREFKCKDFFSEAARIGKPTDPIFEFLPYSTTAYKVTYNTSRKTLDMKVYLSAADVRSGKEVEIIDKYKSEVREWIISKKLDPKNYENMHILIERSSIY